ncbi:MAG: hypothetical protein K2H21_05795, partial [Muribaculaceae bacterium]|nr:hypothetical protein [Muribaculaceae bacterium]
PAASVYDRRGKAIGVTDRQGRLPELAKDAFPLTLRYVGFADRVMEYWERGDTVFMSEDVSELPELLVEERSRKLLHILAYIREYSTLSTYTDTVLLFREKMVDYMLRPDDKVKFRDWSTPRILASRSYYRFGNSEGLDSVSDESQHHFSWSDWLGIPSAIPLPHSLWHRATGRDTVRGRVSAAERWERDDDMVRVEVDVLADTLSRKWVPNLRAFLRSGLDFELFKVNLDYMGVTGDSVTPADMAGYSYRIESKGRGRNMFRFNRFDEPFFVTTEATVYILDKEYILPKEAKQWEKRNFDTDAIGICEPPGAPALSAPTRSLIARVDALNKEDVRLDAVPDARIGHKSDSRKNFQIGYRML